MISIQAFHLSVIKKSVTARNSIVSVQNSKRTVAFLSSLPPTLPPHSKNQKIKNRNNILKKKNNQSVNGEATPFLSSILTRRVPLLSSKTKPQILKAHSQIPNSQNHPQFRPHFLSPYLSPPLHFSLHRILPEASAT